MKRARPEHHLQIEILDSLTIKGRSELEWRAIPNGDLRHPRVAMRLKAEGVKPGTPDLVFALDNGQSGWLELKAKHGVLSPAQKGFAAKVLRLGHHWAMARSLDQAIPILKAWNVLKPTKEEIPA